MYTHNGLSKKKRDAEEEGPRRYTKLKKGRGVMSKGAREITGPTLVQSATRQDEEKEIQRRKPVDYGTDKGKRDREKGALFFKRRKPRDFKLIKEGGSERVLNGVRRVKRALSLISNGGDELDGFGVAGSL